MKAQGVADVLGAVVVFFVVVIAVVSIASIWPTERAQLNQTITNTTGKHVALGLGDNLFNNTLDSVMIFLVFMLMLGALFSAQEQNDQSPATLPLGLIFLIPAILLSMGLSDIGHQFLTTPALLATAIHFKSTLYIMDSLPIFVALGTIAYLWLLRSNKHAAIGGSGGGGSIVVSN